MRPHSNQRQQREIECRRKRPRAMRLDNGMSHAGHQHRLECLLPAQAGDDAPAAPNANSVVAADASHCGRPNSESTRSANAATMKRAIGKWITSGWRFGAQDGSSAIMSSQGASGASGMIMSYENDHGLASSRNRSSPMMSPALGRPVAR